MNSKRRCLANALAQIDDKEYESSLIAKDIPPQKIWKEDPYHKLQEHTLS